MEGSCKVAGFAEVEVVSLRLKPQDLAGPDIDEWLDELDASDEDDDDDKNKQETGDDKSGPDNVAGGVPTPSLERLQI